MYTLSEENTDNGKRKDVTITPCLFLIVLSAISAKK